MRAAPAAASKPSGGYLAVGFCLLGSGLAVYALPGGLAVFVVGTLLWALAEIIEGPTMFAYPAIAGPPAASGRYLGAVSVLALVPAWFAVGRVGSTTSLTDGSS